VAENFIQLVLLFNNHNDYFYLINFIVAKQDHNSSNAEALSDSSSNFVGMYSVLYGNMHAYIKYLHVLTDRISQKIWE